MIPEQKNSIETNNFHNKNGIVAKLNTGEEKMGLFNSIIIKHAISTYHYHLGYGDGSRGVLDKSQVTPDDLGASYLEGWLSWLESHPLPAFDYGNPKLTSFMAHPSFVEGYTDASRALDNASKVKSDHDEYVRGQKARLEKFPVTLRTNEEPEVYDLEQFEADAYEFNQLRMYAENSEYY